MHANRSRATSFAAPILVVFAYRRETLSRHAIFWERNMRSAVLNRSRTKAGALASAIAVAVIFGGAAIFAPTEAQAKEKAENRSQRPAGRSAGLDITFQQFTLPNGLRVVVHTDRKAPIVAINLWYHVGSKDEPKGRSGFAHLYEHLMFQGSENRQGDYFAPFKSVGVTNQNGTTNQDRTNYFQTVPVTALDMALWMESDRMGHLLGAIDQKTLDEQRGVVQNEKRQRETPPYAQISYGGLMQQGLFPKDHPYHHTVVGSIAELNAASLDDVKNWFRTWYGPNNAVLVLAGDIDLDTAKKKVTRYFGDIPAGPTMAQPDLDVLTLPGNTRNLVTDKVPQSAIFRAWNVAKTGSDDIARLGVLAQVLGGSSTSRLDRRLVYTDKLVDEIGASVAPGQLASRFSIFAIVKQGVDPAKVEAAIDEELKVLLRDGPTRTELDQARTVIESAFVRGAEEIGGFGGKSDILASCAVFTSDPACFRRTLKAYQSTTAEQIVSTGRFWLNKGSHTIVVAPGERKPLPEDTATTPVVFEVPKPDSKFKTVSSMVDRSAGIPRVERFPALALPKPQRAMLSNGVTVALVQRRDVPIVNLKAVFPGGFSAEPEEKSGVTVLASNVMTEAAGQWDTIGLKERRESFGAQLSAASGADHFEVGLSAMKQSLAPSLDLFADVLLRPQFLPQDIERIRGNWMAGVRQQRSNPESIAQQLLMPMLYGEGHPYAKILSGMRSEAQVMALGRDDLVAMHGRLLDNSAAQILIVGDTTLDEIVPMLESRLSGWKPSKTDTGIKIAQVEKPAAARVFIVDQPGATQSNIYLGQLIASAKSPGANAFDFANTILGGGATGRLFLNLREDKHWTYGAYSGSYAAIGQRPWFASAGVQTDKTAEAMNEFRKEVGDWASGRRMASDDEIERTRSGNLFALPANLASGWSLLNHIATNLQLGRPDDYLLRYKADNEGMTPDKVKAAAGAIDPNTLTWVVVGDRKQIEQPVRALKLGEVFIVDAQGKPVLE
jgi:zinc protease